MRFGLLILGFLLFGPLDSLAAGPAFPQLTGAVVDEANLLDSTSNQGLTQILQNYKETSGNELIVVTVKSLGGYDIADYGYQLGRAWGIGEKKKDNGVILLVAPNERKVRIEVGYGLEGVLTDANSSAIINQIILPHFKQKEYQAGIEQGVSAILSTLGGDPNAITAPPVATASPFALIIPLLLLLFFFFGFAGSGRSGLLLPLLLVSSFAGGGGSSGRSSGGGGSFGGGGSSGSW